MDHDEAMKVLRGWSGREVVVVAFMTPGVSLRPFTGPLVVEEDERGDLRAVLDETRIAFPRATFHEAGWVAGREGSALSVVQGSTRVDVLLA